MVLLLLTLGYYIFIKKANCFPNVYILLFPILVLMMGLLGLGLGMIISSMTTKYRDLAFLVSFGVQLLMYATTVVYPLSGLDAEAAWVIKLNPMTAIIETFRFGLLGNASFSWGLLGYSFVCSIGVLIVGIFIFNKVEKTFVDTI
jgi:lipopolysaccharide transport system permease protein